MYNLDPTIQERLNSSMQTIANDNDPRPLVYITRNQTAINSQRFWEKQRITETVGTRSSIAIRRPYGSFMGDMIFIAQVEDGDAVIRKAVPKANINDMTWIEVETIPDVSELSLMFDGYMKQNSDRTVEAYTIGELPFVFYVDASGGLNFINLDNETISGTISEDAVNIASIRGLYAEAIDLDDGIWVFYTNSEGELWEAQMLNGEIVGLTQITLLPEGVTSWTDIWAGRSFDWRIILQLKGDDGKVYTLVSKSRPSGFSTLEYLTLAKVEVSGQCGTEPPNLISVETVGGELMNYGTIVCMKFDGKVYNVSSAEKTRYRIIDYYGEIVYPIDVTYGANDHEVYLHFVDINNLVFPAQFECLQTIAMGSDYVSFGAFINEIFLDHLWPVPGDVAYLSVDAVDVAGTIAIAFDGNAYLNDGYLLLSDVTAAGTVVTPTFYKRYLYDGHLALSTVAVAGQYCDINGNPL